MSSYFTSVQVAFLIFPFVALLITLPYILLQYHKYGSVHFFRTTIIYSFILYLMIMYFLVILPLPSINYVSKLTTPTTQLIPFQFVFDMIHGTIFSITDLSTYLPTLKSPAFYTVIFNIFLFVPLGIYLRYYFKCSFFKTIIICFLVSLFFELTQLSGLYGIYPRAYRLFDVDDLIINTTGGIIGYYLTPILYLFLPSRDKIDELSYENGKQVSFFRRIIAFIIDFFIVVFINTIIYLFISYEYQKTIPIIICFYYIIIPWILNGRTVGKFVVQLKLATKENESPKLYQYIIRYGLLYFVLLPTPFYIIELFKICPLSVWYLQIVCLLIIIILAVLYIKFWIQLFLLIITKKEYLSYAKYSNTINISTIKEELIKSNKKN